MKKGKRLYINITNKCNTNCPFCCMFSGTDNDLFMDFDVYKSIIDSCDTDFELQLEGGEPLLHKGLYLFMEYAASKDNCKKIIILTNGMLLDSHLKRIVDFSTFHDIDILIKVSINYWLVKINANHILDIERYIFDVSYIPKVKITCNIRLRLEDKELREYILNHDIIQKNISDNDTGIFNLQSYGKLSDDENYDKPIIAQNIEDWSVYATDGKDFKTDLVARSEYELTIQK